MYDLQKVAYEAVALLADGSRWNLTDVCESIGWEENEAEFAARLNLTLMDLPREGGWIYAKLPLCTAVFLYADWGAGFREVFRGTVWAVGLSDGKGKRFTLTCYDLLYPAQKSQVNQYFQRGMGTRDIVTKLFGEWSVPMGLYQGPNVTHGKLLFKNRSVAAVLTAVLDDARDLGAGRYSVRAREGMADIVPMGSNAEVLILSADENVCGATDRYDMTDMVTRVIIVGKEDREGRAKVEATLNGRVEYGILQAILQKGSGSLSDAMKAAQRVLNERGLPKRSTVLECLDMPGLRKGDRVYVDTARLSGYCFVRGISHDAARRVMRVEVEPV